MPPDTAGYLLLSADVDRRPPFFPASRRKRMLLEDCKRRCADLTREAGVRRAVTFRALLKPPGGRSAFLRRRADRVKIASFDVAILVETESLDSARRLRDTTAWSALEATVSQASRSIHVICASNVKRIGPVDSSRDGVFLFNYFFADDTAQSLAVWEYTAGWFQQETGLDNSTVLLPDRPSESQYTIINHCRYDHLSDILPSLVLKRSFRSFVLDNFELNSTAPMPILYRLA